MALGVDAAATRATVDDYFERLRAKGDWASLLSDDLTFTSFTNPVRSIAGRSVFVGATTGFYSMIRSVEVRQVLADGPRACALTHYVLAPPSGTPFESDVAEIFEVKNGAIVSFGIYFDSAPYPK